MELVVSHPGICSLILMILWIIGFCLGWFIRSDFSNLNRQVVDECTKKKRRTLISSRRR